MISTSFDDWMAWRDAGRPADDPRASSLRAARLCEAPLRFADLSGAELVSAYMRRADLYDANLSGANLFLADLSYANMGNADLREADMSDADLSSANLRGASLYKADLRGACLRGADLHQAKGITSAGPVGRERRIIYAVDHGERVMVKAGCKWGDAGDIIEMVKFAYALDRSKCEAYIATIRAMVATLEAAR